MLGHVLDNVRRIRTFLAGIKYSRVQQPMSVQFQLRIGFNRKKGTFGAFQSQRIRRWWGLVLFYSVHGFHMELKQGRTVGGKCTFFTMLNNARMTFNVFGQIFGKHFGRTLWARSQLGQQRLQQDSFQTNGVR